MFRRLESGLPKDPVFPATLEGLGYYINENDEIRNLENPKAYFKFFLTKNDRYNCVQRESLNEVIRQIVLTRLQGLGLEALNVPLGATDTEPHLPILVSKDLASKKRVIVLFSDPSQDLGVFAHRIIGGPGGINAGSAVNLVKYILTHPSCASSSFSPGIILANTGQLRWWRRGKKAVTQTSWFALPQKSACEPPFRFDSIKNTIPGNRSTAEHVQYVFEHVLDGLCAHEASFEVIGVGDGAVQVAEYLNRFDAFATWGERVKAFAGVGTTFHAREITNVDFGEWLKARGRVYLTSISPQGTFLAPANGTKYIPAHGCPAFSLGEPYYIETMLAKGYRTVIDWFAEVAGEEHYENPEFVRFDEDEEDLEPVWEEAGIEMGGGRLNAIEAGEESE